MSQPGNEIDVRHICTGAATENNRHRHSRADAADSDAAERAASGAICGVPAGAEGVQDHQPGSVDRLSALHRGGARALAICLLL